MLETSSLQRKKKKRKKKKKNNDPQLAAVPVRVLGSLLHLPLPPIHQSTNPPSRAFPLTGSPGHSHLGERPKSASPNTL
ncbi:uncharacterized protein H6S33_005715 [Morchella sextelata]|uniref:uncharacterized protein n=1 Tax=Morchella sextelata TaxID=1174677 RepID=UPI001D04BD2D|nr:uncharacterized protein H6S33_005715 [Morchella sextelata]KAH0613829.1 hypothetical protein H6S33_005715 [Morchella sextelata]